jgi:hypothetical protein
MTLVPAGTDLPALGAWTFTVAGAALLPGALRSLPSLQSAARSAFRAALSFLPFRFGTLQTTGPGPRGGVAAFPRRS